MKFSDWGGGCDQFLLPENISTYPRIILKETLWNYGQFSNKEMTEWSWALDFSICLLPALKKPRSSEFYEGDWFPWTPLDRSIDSLEPKILGWSWTLEFSIRLLLALKKPRSSEFYEGDWFPWTPLDRSIDSLEPKILGWSWTSSKPPLHRKKTLHETSV